MTIPGGAPAALGAYPSPTGYTMLYKDGLPLKALAIDGKPRNDVLFADLRGNKKIIKIVVSSFRGATS